MVKQFKAIIITLVLLPITVGCKRSKSAVSKQPKAALLPSSSVSIEKTPINPITAPVQPTETEFLQPSTLPPTATIEGVLSPFGYKEVYFTTEDGLTLAGRLFGEGDFAVILTHQGYATQDTWLSFAQRLGELGFSALTLDFRGNGHSESPLKASQLVKDVHAANNFLHNRGFKSVACVGASFGGTSCLKAGIENPLVGIIVIASRPSEGSPTAITPKDYPFLTMPKLFTYGIDDKDGYIHKHMTSMYELSVEPKEIVIFPESVHGTDLFYTPSGDDFRALIINFLIELRDISN